MNLARTLLRIAASVAITAAAWCLYHHDLEGGCTALLAAVAVLNLQPPDTNLPK